MKGGRGAIFSVSCFFTKGDKHQAKNIQKKMLAVFVTISSSPVSNVIVWGGESSQIVFLRLSKNSLNMKKICLHMDDYTGLWCLIPRYIYFAGATKRPRYFYIYKYTYICIYIYIYVYGIFQYFCFMGLCTASCKIMDIIGLLALLLSKKFLFQTNDNLCSSKPSFMKS